MVTRIKTPYASATNINTLFDRMEGLGPPQRIDAHWVESYGLAKQNSAITNLLKWLGVIDENGNVDPDIWNELRANHEEKLAELVHSSYSAVFEQLPDIGSVTDQDLRGAFISAYKVGNTDRPIRAFRALCQRAGLMPVEPRDSSGSGTTQTKKGKDANKSSTRSTPTRPISKPSSRTKDGQDDFIQINLNVEIPADWSEGQIHERLVAIMRIIEDY